MNGGAPTKTESSSFAVAAAKAAAKSKNGGRKSQSPMSPDAPAEHPGAARADASREVASPVAGESSSKPQSNGVDSPGMHEGMAPRTPSSSLSGDEQIAALQASLANAALTDGKILPAPHAGATALGRPNRGPGDEGGTAGSRRASSSPATPSANGAGARAQGAAAADGDNGPRGDLPASKFRQIVCRHWFRGFCMKGDQCTFLHHYAPDRMPQCQQWLRYGTCRDANCQFKHSGKRQDERGTGGRDRGGRNKSGGRNGGLPVPTVPICGPAQPPEMLPLGLGRGSPPESDDALSAGHGGLDGGGAGGVVSSRALTSPVIASTTPSGAAGGSISARATPSASRGLYGSGGRQGSGGSSGERRGSKPSRGYVCHRCGIPGHWKKDCPYAPRPSHGQQGAGAAYMGMYGPQYDPAIVAAVGAAGADGSSPLGTSPSVPYYMMFGASPTTAGGGVIGGPPGGHYKGKRRGSGGANGNSGGAPNHHRGGVAAGAGVMDPNSIVAQQYAQAMQAYAQQQAGMMGQQQAGYDYTSVAAAAAAQAANAATAVATGDPTTAAAAAALQQQHAHLYHYYYGGMYGANGAAAGGAGSAAAVAAGGPSSQAQQQYYLQALAAQQHAQAQQPTGEEESTAAQHDTVSPSEAVAAPSAESGTDPVGSKIASVDGGATPPSAPADSTAEEEPEDTASGPSASA
eukprot:PRCOL_00006800-RA